MKYVPKIIFIFVRNPLPHICHVYRSPPSFPLRSAANHSVDTVASKLNYERATRPPFLCHPRGNACTEESGGKANLNDDQARAFHRVDVPICRDEAETPLLLLLFLSLSKEIVSRRKNRKEEEEERRRIRGGTGESFERDLEPIGRAN